MRVNNRMRVLACAAAATALGVSSAASAALLVYEPFNYTAGQAISGQMNTTSALPETWLDAGTVGTTVHQVGSPGLSTPPGVYPSSGNMADLKQTDVGEMDRLNLPYAVGFGGSALPTWGTSSTLYYSLLVDVPSTTGLTIAHTNPNANNDLIAGLNNAQGTQATRPSTWGGELNIRLGSVANTFNLGIRASTTTASTTYFTPDLTPGQTYYIVVAASIDSTGSNGTNSIWVNPDPSTYGQASAPTPDGSDNGTGGTAYSYQSLLIGSGIATGAVPSDVNVDEIRIGDTWADVTTNNAPLAVPEPTGLTLLGLGALALRRRRRC